VSDPTRPPTGLTVRSADEIALRPFALRWEGDAETLEGARWWNEAQRTWQTARKLPFGGNPDAPSRRNVLLWSIGGVVAVAFALRIRNCEDRGDPVVSMDALKLQQQMGWNAGHSDARLSFPSSLQAGNADREPLSTEAMTTLWSVLRPTQTTWSAFYVPTLFRSLADDRAGDLRAQMTMVHTDDMETTYERGLGIVDLFDEPGAPTDVALILDLPGPEAVALAAALATWFEPVWLFDNWPHPLGVVPSHQVLGAALYYLPLLERAAQARGASGRRPPPPMFVLDANRLAPYTDEADRFDNRYLARLPSAQALRDAGYRRVLYVRPWGYTTDQLRELDDLNDDFVAYRDEGIDVRAMAVNDFRLEPARLDVTGPRGYVWGGTHDAHPFFWHTYGWSTSSSRPPSAVALPSGLGVGASYQPVLRPTMFSSRSLGMSSGGIGKQRPSGFGVVSVRQSPSGRISGVGAGRSGSFGRYGGSSFFG